MLPFTVVVLDQFCGMTAATLRQSPLRLEDCQPGGAYYESYATLGPYTSIRKPRIERVYEDFVPRMATTVLKPNAEGFLEIWRYRWDSSG